MPDETPPIAPIAGKIVPLHVGDEVKVGYVTFKVTGYDGPNLHLVGPENVTIQKPA